VFDRKQVLERITRARLQPGSSTQQSLETTAEELAEAIVQYSKRENPLSCGALKVLHAVTADEAFEKQLDRMKAEVDALRTLQHPNIIRILDANLDHRWFVMQYFPGGPLAAHMSENIAESAVPLRMWEAATGCLVGLWVCE
jgi:serine/threonine protein kinase